MAKKQYIVSTYVRANSATEALRLAGKMKPHEAYVHNSWWEKRGWDWEEWEDRRPYDIGFTDKK